MKIAILTNEYPPNIYGGAGVHIEYLTKELSLIDDAKHNVKVLCFGRQNEDDSNLTVTGIDEKYNLPVSDTRHQKFLDTMLKNIIMSGMLKDVDIIHCHTWYAHFAGILLKQLLQVPLILTTHSLEPHRPWKKEQLGTAYHASSWIEKTAYENADGVIAVSNSMKEDVCSLYNVLPEKVKTIHNGIDIKDFNPCINTGTLNRYNIDKNVPYILFVGRITRQKGIIHLVNAIKHIKEGVQIVLCAGEPDTEEIGIEMKNTVDSVRNQAKNNIIWIPEMIPKEDLSDLYAQASLFVCPSVYEPFGIINLEAMACKTPVVAANVGGIPEVVIPNETGILVSFNNKGNGSIEPDDPNEFSYDLACAVNLLLKNPEKMKQMGEAARQRVEKYFTWKIIAEQTLGFYESVLGK